jgi:catechol 2,3-dioxygenase-like lactoylglutathione lyase family enzyme
MHQAAFPDEDISDRPLPDVSVPGLLRLLTEDFDSGRYQAQRVGESTHQPWLNLVLTVDNFEASRALFQEQLGMGVEKEWHEVGNGLLLNAGKATIELVDATQAAEVDRIEVGYPTGNTVRLALSVADVEAAGRAFVAQGAAVGGHVVETSWGHRNQRVVTAEGLAVTLFQEVESLPQPEPSA